MVRKADVLISAGHEGRVTGKKGAPGQIEWTPKVANRATAVLEAAGISVIREDADFSGGNETALAIFIHFDGSEVKCSSGASIGYNDNTDKPAADAWREIYKEFWPYKWNPDNFTPNLKDYYGYKLVKTSDAELVLEMGEISCPEQKAWMAPRLEFLGELVAYFVSQRLGKGDIARPEFP